MVHPDRYPPPDDGRTDTDRERDRRVPASTPRWAKVFVIITLIVTLLLVVMLLTGRGGHGPGRHAPSGDAGRDMPVVAAQEHTPPEGDHRRP